MKRGRQDSHTQDTGNRKQNREDIAGGLDIHSPANRAEPGIPAATVGDYNDAVRFNRLVTLFCILLIGIVPQLFVVL